MAESFVARRILTHHLSKCPSSTWHWNELELQHGLNHDTMRNTMRLLEANRGRGVCCGRQTRTSLHARSIQYGTDISTCYSLYAVNARRAVIVANRGKLLNAALVRAGSGADDASRSRVSEKWRSSDSSHSRQQLDLGACAVLQTSMSLCVWARNAFSRSTGDKVLTSVLP